MIVLLFIGKTKNIVCCCSDFRNPTSGGFDVRVFGKQQTLKVLRGDADRCSQTRPGPGSDLHTDFSCDETPGGSRGFRRNRFCLVAATFFIVLHQETAERSTYFCILYVKSPLPRTFFPAVTDRPCSVFLISILSLFL